MSSLSEPRIRRNIHTYPFKYRRHDPAAFFAPERAVAYIHIPFCSTRCHFCDYVIQTGTTEDERAVYVDALREEIRAFARSRAFPEFQLHAIYVGGGTPGLLEASQLLGILTTCREAFQLTDDCEVSVEFDPACVELEKLRALREGGYNRLSVGIQSFDERILRENNRPHTVADCYRAWDAVRQSGFTHTNIDLIYPLLNLDLATWQDSMDRALALEPACITAYSIEIWPGTAYYTWLKKNTRQLPPSEIETAMCRDALDRLEAAGFTRGSTGGHYHPGRCERLCRYLEYYWRTYPLIGFGVSSKSVIHNRLYTNIRSRREYVRRVRAGEPLMDFGTYLTKEQEMRRVMIRGLKMCTVSKPEFQERFGVEMEAVFGPELAEIERLGFVENRPDSVVLTREGQVFSTNVWERFFTPDDLRDPDEHEISFGLSELVVT